LRALILVVFLAGCSSLNPLGFLSGGTNVAANTQAGKQNNQTIGTSTVQEFGTQTVQAERVNSSQGQTTRVNASDVQTVVVNEVPTWIILLLVVGWLFPSPGEMGRIIRGWLSGKRP
jgi:hypothetical protein